MKQCPHCEETDTLEFSINKILCYCGNCGEYININKMNNVINTPKSSVIKSLTYDENRKDLSVNFQSGKLYVYTPVSQQFFNKLQNAESKGKFFNKNIRDNEALTCLKLIK
jgi:hypothetical protein